ncbi:hypothetical protein NX784_23590 [Massilia pinisoli]|uniref:Uncharacterized protein n=1 Tax=Massilia pinisoli TaxID=1772194 RepID=A0ABT1ZXB2_9BURK|nr:hypothetical protein [Massilia pinisoli]MCS0584573.1 hypothetical protein [Massilia pinisoli]
MSVKKAEPKPPFDYLVCLDVIVVACILVIAGRPDGLAITVSAIVVAACALVYRCTAGAASYVAGKSRVPAAPPEVDRAFAPTTYEAPQETMTVDAKKSSWLREDD